MHTCFFSSSLKLLHLFTHPLLLFFVSVDSQHCSRPNKCRYGEHFASASGESADGSGYGGIYCMSSSDLVTWRNEGLMLDFRNLTDMVNGPPPRGAKLVADRPKVVFNNFTQLYVMFMHMEYAHDTDPNLDNSEGGYGYLDGGDDDDLNDHDGSARSTSRRATAANGATMPANPNGGLNSATYPGSHFGAAETEVLRALKMRGLSEAGASVAAARLGSDVKGTDGGLTAAATTVGSSPGGHRAVGEVGAGPITGGDGKGPFFQRYALGGSTGIAAAVQAGTQAPSPDAETGDHRKAQSVPVHHSNRGTDGLGGGVGDGLDEERGHYQEHNWVRRQSLGGNWTGTQLGMAAIATSAWPNGPFDFRRSFYPDGNKTKDQTVFAPHRKRHPVSAAAAAAAASGKDVQPEDDESENALLGRTYYASVEYVLPLAVMQPIWESVKKPDAKDERDIDFALSYHRAFYESDYDKYHDIYLQR